MVCIFFFFSLTYSAFYQFFYQRNFVKPVQLPNNSSDLCMSQSTTGRPYGCCVTPCVSCLRMNIIRVAGVLCSYWNQNKGWSLFN